MTTHEPTRPTGTRHAIFQSSVMTALLDGVYDGDLTVSDLLDHGDFGIGTFDALDGEMVVLDGACYRLRSDGSVSRPDATEYTPYAVVTRFVPHVHETLPGILTRAEVGAAVDRMVRSANYMYALRLHGLFREVTTRTVTKQSKPYRPMVTATDDDQMLTFRDTWGTVAAFRTPLFEQGLSVPGCHAHFLSDDHGGGGHVLDFTVEDCTVELCLATDLHLRLPETEAFERAALAPDDLHAQLQKTEAHA